MTYARSSNIIFTDMLGALDHLVGKAQLAGMTDDVLAAKLTEDLFDFELQFRVALNQVLLALNQLTGRSVPLEAVPSRSLDEVRERISAVRAQLDGTELGEWEEPDATVDLTLPNGVRFVMSAEEDLRDWLLPNFYFHATMAYALLRYAGLAVGKVDFLQHMDRYRRP